MLASLSAVFDFMDAEQEYRKRGISIIYIAYSARGLAILALSVSQFLVALGTLVPWLDGIIKRSIERTFWVRVAEFGLFLGRFALLESVAAALALINFYATFIIIVVSVVVVVFDDNALQKWFDRCCFSKDPDHDKFDDLTDELTEFHQAIKETF